MYVFRRRRVNPSTPASTQSCPYDSHMALAYCSMLSIVATVITALGRQNLYFDAEACGFVHIELRLVVLCPGSLETLSHFLYLRSSESVKWLIYFTLLPSVFQLLLFQTLSLRGSFGYSQITRYIFSSNLKSIMPSLIPIILRVCMSL
jgi:hypothetical protein